jgi:hypothetical protein
MLKVHPKTVLKWLRHFRAGGVAGLEVTVEINRAKLPGRAYIPTPTKIPTPGFNYWSTGGPPLTFPRDTDIIVGSGSCGSREPGCIVVTLPYVVGRKCRYACWSARRARRTN